MITITPYDKLGNTDYGWLNAHYHFSFGEYRDPARMGFGALRVINDDIIGPNTGFDTHPHKDMEIITYVRSGAITHKDSTGNEGRTEAGDVQVMSAGTASSIPRRMPRVYRPRSTRSGSFRASAVCNHAGMRKRFRRSL
jgi:redox-sensitive bicupin YhaK (pirin superfamily)